MSGSLERLKVALADKYIIERELGGGGMSRVFVAQESALGRSVVIKVIAPELLEGVSAERFAREVKLAARLQQANIVPVLAAGDGAGMPYYVMPFVPGESLRTRMTSDTRVSVADAVSILRDVARALAYAHAEGVVHRDIKPENILLSHGTAVVTDFGIAKAISASRTEAGLSTETLTQLGTSIGTPAYMAPEQVAGDPNTDARADIYAWGVVAWELLAGKHPFADKTTPQALIAAQMSSTPAAVTTSRPDVTPALSELIRRCLEKDPTRRPAHATELLTALDAVGTPGSVVANPLPAGKRRRVVFSALVLLALPLWMLWMSKHRARAPASSAPGEISLAVLPIENVGGDSATEYLADGMTGELSGALKNVPGLQVAGDLSTARFKGTHTDPAEIARALGVGMLLTGKLQPSQGRIRLQMQLSSAAGKLLWSNTYNRDSKDNFAMEDEITSAIATELRVVLSPMTLAVARAGRTVNPQAHDLFLQGRFEQNKMSANGLARAKAYYEAALKLDPNYAQAHAGLAFVYDIQADVFEPSHEYHTLAMNEAKLAVASDSLLAEARVQYGFELAAARWDFAGGKAEMERGLALNPNSQDALTEIGFFSMLSGDTARALAISARLVALDPLSALAARARAEALLWAGRDHEALQQSAVATKLDPTVMLIDATDGNALRELGRLDESLAAFLAFKKAFGLPSFGIIMTYAKMGRRDDALREVHALEERGKKEWVDPDFIAIGYAAIGDKDHAMMWLNKAFEMKTFGLRLFLNWDCPWLRPMWDDPRYIALKQKVLATTWTL